MKKLLIALAFIFAVFTIPTVHGLFMELQETTQRELSDMERLETPIEPESGVSSIVYSPDGNYITYRDGNGDVHIHNTDDYELEQSLQEPTAGGSYLSVAYSPNSNYIVVSDTNGDVHIHNTDDYELEQTLQETEYRVETIAYSPDGNYIAYGNRDGEVFIHNTNDYELEQTLTEPNDRVSSVVYSPDGNHIAYSSGDDNVYIHNTDDYELEQTLTEPEGSPWPVVYSPDGNYIAYSADEDGKVFIHNTDDYELEQTLDKPAELGRWLYFVTYSSDGNYIAYGDEDGDVYIHNTDDYELEQTLQESADWGTIDAIAFSPNDSHIAYGNWEEEIYIHEFYEMPQGYTVEFIDHDGTILDEQTVDEGEDAVPPDDPYRSGYNFDGWDGDYTDITEDTTITATYEARRTAQEVINDWLGIVGLDGPFGSMFIVVVIMIGVSFMAAINHAPLPVLILINLIILLLAVLLGFIPAWVLIGLAMTIMLMIYVVLTDIPIGGGNE